MASRRPDGPFDPPQVDTAARAVERLNQAIAALAQHGREGGAEKAQGTFQGLAKDLFALKTVATAFQQPATALGRAYRDQSRNVELVTRSMSRYAQAARQAAAMTDRQVGAMLTANARQRREQMQAEATFSRQNAALAAKALYQDAYGVGAGRSSKGGDTRAKLEEERSAARAARDLSTQQTFEAALSRSVEASLRGSAVDRPQLAQQSLAEVTLQQQDERARLARAQQARRLEFGEPTKEAQGVGTPLAVVRSIQARQASAYHLGARRQLEEEGLALQRNVRLAQARGKALSSPEAQAEVRRQVQMQRELAKAREQEAFVKSKAEKGAFGAHLDDASRRMGEVAKQLQGAASVAQGAFGAIAGGIAGLTAVADPFSTWPTFTESVKGLSIELGSNFLPVMDRLSLGLQNAERWMSRLGPEPRRWGANLLVMAAGAGVAVLAVAKLTAAFGALAGASTFLLTTPAGWAVLATAVGGAAAAYALLGRSAKDAAAGMKDAAGAGAPGGPGRNPRSLQPGDLARFRPDLQRQIEGAAGKGPDGLGSFLSELAQSSDQMAKAMQKAQGAGIPGRGPLERLLAEKQAEAARIEALANQGVRGQTAQVQARRDAFERSARPGLEGAYRKAGIDPSGLTFAKLLGGDPLKARDSAYDSRIAAAQQQAAEARSLMEKLGLSDPLSRAYRGPQAAILSDPMELGNRLQLAGLKGDDKASENLEKQVRNLERSNELLKEIREATYEQLRRNAPSYRGH